MRRNVISPPLLWGAVLWLTALDLVFVAAGLAPFPYYSRGTLPGGYGLCYMLLTTILGAQIWQRLSGSEWGRRSVGPMSRWLLVPLVIVAGTMIPVCKTAAWYSLSYSAAGGGEVARAAGFAAMAVVVTASKLWIWRQAYLLRGLAPSEIWATKP